MKGREVHDMADDQLLELIANTREELFNLRFQHATGQLENTAGLGHAKRNLARGLTVAHERGLDYEAELKRQRENA